jgi:hypothetical protein
MAEDGTRLKTIATLVGIVGGIVGIYKACQNPEPHKERAEAAFLQATRGAIKINEPPPGREHALNVAPPTEMTIAIQNRGKHDAINLHLATANALFFHAEKNLPVVLGPGETVEFSWWVETQVAKPWGVEKSSLFKHPQRGSLTWTDRITKQTGRSDWCFYVTIRRNGEPNAQTLEPCETSPPR